MSLPNVNQVSSSDYILQDQTFVFAVKNGGYIASIKSKDRESAHWKKVIDVEDSVTSIAVDWMSGNIYWISTSKPYIQVTTSNGLYKTVVVKNLYQPFCLTISPSTGLMCYFDAGSVIREESSRIECAEMDGIQPRVVWYKSKFVVGLSFADSGRKIYWADRGKVYQFSLLGVVFVFLPFKAFVYSRKVICFVWPVALFVRHKHLPLNFVKLST